MSAISASRCVVRRLSLKFHAGTGLYRNLNIDRSEAIRRFGVFGAAP
jgi:hypothetical protein